MYTISDILLHNRAIRLLIFISSVLVGLNIIVAASYFALTEIANIKEPLTTFSNQKLIGSVLSTLSWPLLVLIASIAGFYFGSKSPKEDSIFRTGVTREGRDRIVVPTWLKKPAFAAMVLLINLFIAGILIALNTGLEFLVTKLWQQREPTLFGIAPLTWVFHAFDLVLLAIVLVYGLWEAFLVLKQEE